MVVDSIGDLLIRIKNAYLAKKDSTKVCYSKINEKILAILKKNRYIKDFKVEKSEREILIELLYFGRRRKRAALDGVVRISKPGVRIYEDTKGLRKYLSEVGLIIVSTPKGLMRLRRALKENTGGEVICRVW